MQENSAPDGFRWYSEGRVRFLAPIFPATEAGEPIAPTKIPVFYNPFSKPSRDMTVLLVAAFFNKRITAAEPLAGSGVRGIRLLKETENVEEAYLNDLNPSAYNVIKLNAEANGVADKVVASNQEASLFLARHSEARYRFEYVDVDPVGAPVRFLENSIRACGHLGVVGASATDLAALTGVKPRPCIRKYDAIPMHVAFSKEIAIRIMMGFVARAAARLNAGIEPLLSYYHRHFIRVFAQVKRGRSGALQSIQEIGWLTYCGSCMRIETTPLTELPDRLCRTCGSGNMVAGPLWVGRLSDNSLAGRMLERVGEDYDEARRALSRIVSEDTSLVGYYPIPLLSRWARRSPPPPKAVIEELRNLGYRASQTHIDPNAVKTDAPPEDIKRVLSTLP
ncbi:MAG TPA: tRNA (guanine(10)-N(2))-dimethyltransferase [Candidatus Caldiarchaeum subterraneum]|uniref:tRNA (guanine(26)-N(2))-dimethyltransferase n=1 Tax=Caldiarchaeum subterraneum TaxID=311458 RepID=A0A833EC87_CALS0|nr:tRNA (guanine(10)-N(2))-dimethyltransferase [Aigarchaeota archaeon]HIQ29570.1 tRNA (guanine(10)-N(2))-dimethyltransferase [Candidatus Caldarchaeum subterraneum]